MYLSPLSFLGDMTLVWHRDVIDSHSTDLSSRIGWRNGHQSNR